MQQATANPTRTAPRVLSIVTPTGRTADIVGEKEGSAEHDDNS